METVHSLSNRRASHTLKPVVIKQLLIILLSDLAEVMSVTPAAPAPGPPKKTDDKSFFDVSKVMH